MPSSKYVHTSMAALLLSGASAHMIMNTPKPFGQPISSPLGKTNAFPCQSRPIGQYDMSQSTTVVAGSSTLLSFHGSAVHGGGSCQVSLSKTASSNPKDWKVIHTIIGNCPATAGGNLQNLGPEGAPVGLQCNSATEVECVKQYNVNIPADVASGQYLFAWTWFNKLGNREMYMNCAPLTITGGSSSDDFLNAQPSIFTANVDNQPCNTAGNNDLVNTLDIPNPGLSVENSTNPSDATSSVVLGTCASLYPAFNAPASGSSFSNSSSTTGYAPTSVGGSEVTTATSIIETITSTSIGAPGVFVPGASSAPTISSAVSAVSAVSSATPATLAASCTDPCPIDVTFICIGSNSWGMCDHGCAVQMALAASTTCVNGLITKRGVYSSKPRYAYGRQFFA